jgi:hypothetical protein
MFYINKPVFDSQFVRLYVSDGRVLAHDVRREDGWERLAEAIPPASISTFSDMKHALERRGYKPVLNQVVGNPYRYFRCVHDEESRLEAKRVHWQERRAIEHDLPVTGL